MSIQNKEGKKADQIPKPEAGIVINHETTR